MRIIILFAFLLATAGALKAQDLHFTQYNMAGPQLNPAATGGFYGTFRVGGIYRSQWYTGFGTTLYSTPMAFIDAPVYRGFRKQDWFGVGMTYSQDNAGTLRIGRTSMLGSLSYHFSLDKKQRHVLTLGYQWGNHGFKVKNIQNANPEDQILGGSTTDMINPEAETYQGSNVGLQLTSQISDRTKLNLGAAMFRLSRANVSLVQSGGGAGARTRIPSRLVFHGGVEQRIGEQFMVMPSFMMQSQSGSGDMELLIQAMGGVYLPLKDQPKDKPQEVLAMAGLGSRFGDALQVLIGGQYGPYRVGFAYDINTSDLSQATQNVGGVELALTYIAVIKKKPKPKPTIFCPRL